MSLFFMLAAAAASPVAKPVPSAGEIVAASPAADWQTIAPQDLLVMDLASDAAGRPRRVVIQLMPPPFSQGWVGNIRKLAGAHWWDGLSVYRVQDNWVSQWGDGEGEDKSKAKPLPAGLAKVPQEQYVSPARVMSSQSQPSRDAYAPSTGYFEGWPIAYSTKSSWPVHCYGSIGVARDNPPDSGTGAELYAVIGHAPRQLDRNLAVVGRVIEGMQHLSSLPRGPAPMGVYANVEERTPIVALHPATEVPDLPRYEYLSTTSGSFDRYAEASANHREPFYVQPAGGIDICNLKVPVRRKK
ncbi:peptidylprolyl isomerase [Novosphingobium hassiacum]|uniref:peptidylprolyl isomerase n=1 Tax=Novosphingobium hassiacum TaxID=173676 RepID=A0A7W6EUK8_9SPHN|nr:peptidylprolyl isomerase [Novosphingobium hassiacum]MBB3858829.1 peptidylprolyl isomerase [Novosphingobium hassiacum]